MMNWIIGLIVAAVVVLGGGYYLMNSGSLSMEEDTSLAGGTMPAGSEVPDNDMVGGDAVAPKASTGAFTGSWNDLVKRGGNYVCEVNHSSNTDVTAGKVYVSGTNVRGDFTSLVAGKSVESHMLKMNDTVYVWGAGMPQGVMMSASMMSGDASTGSTQGSGVKADHSYDWNCSATGADKSLFVKPTNIEFMDVSAMMQGAGAMPKVPAY